MRQKDLAFGTLTLVVSIAYYWLASRIPDSQLADAIGPRGLPIVYAMALAALSGILIVRSLPRAGRVTPVAAKAHESETVTAEGSKRNAVAAHDVQKAAGTLAFGVLYIAVVPWLGYVLSLAGLIFATARYQGAGAGLDRRVAIVAVTGALFCWVLFVFLMRIPQPRGLWPSLP